MIKSFLSKMTFMIIIVGLCIVLMGEFRAYAETTYDLYVSGVQVT